MGAAGLNRKRWLYDDYQQKYAQAIKTVTQEARPRYAMPKVSDDLGIRIIKRTRFDFYRAARKALALRSRQ